MIYLMVVFFCLSFIMAHIILKLPYNRCQMMWSVVSVWGIANVVSAVFLYAIWYVPDVTVAWLYWSLWLVFLSALPGMLWLNWKQIRMWRGELRRRDREIAMLKSQLELEYIVKKTRYKIITEQVNN